MQDSTNKMTLAVEAYANGERTPSITSRFEISFSQLYREMDRLGVPLRSGRDRVRKASKPGRPLERPFLSLCDWCGAELSAYQVKRRRKYCGLACQKEAVNNARESKYGRCTAPGCNEPIKEADMPFCSWECFQAMMKVRFD